MHCGNKSIPLYFVCRYRRPELYIRKTAGAPLLFQLAQFFVAIVLQGRLLSIIVHMKMSIEASKAPCRGSYRDKISAGFNKDCSA